MRMLPRCCGITALLFASAILAALPQSKPPDKYQTLVARLKQGDKTVDFLELRRAYADSAEYTDGSNPDESKAMSGAFNKGDFAQALAHSKKILDDFYLDIDAHHIAYLAAREMHHPEEAEFHNYIVHGLIDAIFHTGDGKSPKTAWEVISTDEEYVILRVLGLNPASQSLMNSGAHSYDKLNVIDPKTQQKVTLYFNIDTPMNHLHRILSK